MGGNLPKCLNLKTFSSNAKGQSSRLFKLSDELLVLVFRSIRHPRDQVAFMLSCKNIASISSGIDLNSIQINVWSGRKLLTPTYAHRHLVADMRKWAYIPAHTQFCKSCEKYLPKHRVWTDKKGISITTLKYIDWMWAVAQWTKGRKICPNCQISVPLEESKN